MLLSQQHSEPTGAGTTSTGTLAQWRIGLDHPGEIICTGPKYQYAYVSDNIHLTNPEYERLGEKYGEVMYQRVVLGERLAAAAAHHASSAARRVITVHFHVPSPPLAWDTTLPMPHQSAFTEWAQGRGFEVRNGTTRDRDQQRRDRGRHRPDHLRDRPARVRRRRRLRVDRRRHDPPERHRPLGPAARQRIRSSAR